MNSRQRRRRDRNEPISPWIGLSHDACAALGQAYAASMATLAALQVANQTLTEELAWSSDQLSCQRRELGQANQELARLRRELAARTKDKRRLQVKSKQIAELQTEVAKLKAQNRS